MRTLKLTIAYDGTAYNGFQRQINGLGIQQVLEDALTELLQEKIVLTASGRTDAGVHAVGQVVSFTTKATIPAGNIPLAIKYLLPEDIVVVKGEEASPGFNARYAAHTKTYIYRIFLTKLPDPCKRHYAWQLHYELDLAAMQEAADYLVGTHDFSAFRNVGSKQVSPVRTITQAQWQRTGKNELVFTITGDGFLYRMVRNIVGLLVKVGRKQVTPEAFAQIMASKERKLVGMAAPAQGLYLLQVQY